MPKNIVRLGILLIVVGSCGDGSDLTGFEPPDVPAHAISDGTFGGTAGFHFLPPLVRKPNYAGSFDPGLEPTVRIECTSAGCAPAIHAVFGPDSGGGIAQVQASEADQHYMVVWQSGHTGAVAGETYRIHVGVGDQDLGFIDVAVVRPGREAVQARVQGLVAIVPGQALPLKFRIETDIIAGLVVSPAEATIEEGESHPFAATFLNLHGEEVSGPAVLWGSADEDVATVSPDGLAIGVAPGVTSIIAAAGSLSGSATLNIEPGAPAGSLLSPGDTETIASLDGWSVRCLVWSGRVCTRPQVRMDSSVCESYQNGDVWHDLTTMGNDLQQRATTNFCAIATGNAGSVSSGAGSAPISPRACGLGSPSHPICSAGQATFHAAGFGINASFGLALDDEFCDFDTNPRLTLECSAW